MREHSARCDRFPKAEPLEDRLLIQFGLPEPRVLPLVESATLGRGTRLQTKPVELPAAHFKLRT